MKKVMAFKTVIYPYTNLVATSTRDFLETAHSSYKYPCHMWGIKLTKIVFDIKIFKNLVALSQKSRPKNRSEDGEWAKQLIYHNYFPSEIRKVGLRQLSFLDRRYNF